MFGFSFGELVVLIIVAIVVIGPKDLPKVLRRVGQWAGKLRRMAADLRAQSGIDEVLRSEGLSEDINEIRKLARGELDNVVRSARIDTQLGTHLGAALAGRPEDPYATSGSGGAHGDPGFPIDRDREYPREGADGYRALPDTAIVYAEHFPPSPHAKDALYMLGDANAVMPVEAPRPELEPAPLEAAPPQAGSPPAPGQEGVAPSPPAPHADPGASDSGPLDSGHA